MKLLIDGRTFGDKPSGIGIYTYNFVKEIIKHRDIEVEVVSDVGNSEEMRYLKQCANVKVHLMERKTQKSIRTHITILCMLF